MELHKMTFIEFSVKRSLMRQYMAELKQEGKLTTIKAVFQNYIDHLISLIPDENLKSHSQLENVFIANKKIYKLLTLVLIIIDNYRPNCNFFYDANIPFELSRYILMSCMLIYDHDYYYFTLNSYLLKHLIQYYQGNDLTNSQIEETINTKSLLEKVDGKDVVQFETLQILVEFKILREDYDGLDVIFKLFDKFNHSNQKIEIYRELYAEVQNALSPITDAEEMEDERVGGPTTQVSNKQSNKIHNVTNDNCYLDLLQSNYSIPQLNCALLDYSTQQGNIDCLQQLQMMVQTNDMIMDNIIKLYMIPVNQLTLNHLRAIVHTQAYFQDIHLIQILARVILYKWDQMKFKKLKRCINKLITMNLLLILINKHNNTNVSEIDKMVDLVVATTFQQPVQIDYFTVNISMILNILLGQLHFIHHQIVQAKKKSTPIDGLTKDLLVHLTLMGKIFVKLETQDFQDILRNYIESCLSKSILDTFQAILIFKPNQDWKQQQHYHPMLTILYELVNLPEFCISQRAYLVDLSFKREKSLLVRQFQNLEGDVEQLEFKYSKIYKKQIIYYFRIGQWEKSIKKALKYYSAYLPQIELAKPMYLAEEQVLFCIFHSLMNLKQYEEGLILSQFLNVPVNEQVEDGINQVELTKSMSEYFFDGDLIQRICQQYCERQDILQWMMVRIQDSDSYMIKTMEVQNNIKERYLNRFIMFLSQKMYKLIQ